MSDSNIEKLENLLGKRWVDSQLEEYQSFRQQHSPVDLWSHRHPTTPPIIPLLFHYHHPDHITKQYTPFGHWYGDPIEPLRRLADDIYSFEGYWSLMPKHLLENHFKFKLSNSEQFDRFLFELLVAKDCRREYKDRDVHLLFFDPAAVKGAPQIVLRRGYEEVDVYCRTIVAVSSPSMSLDVFQYLFGCFYRLVQESPYNYKLAINLRQPPTVADVDGLLAVLRPVVESGSGGVLKDMRDPVYDVELFKLNTPVDGLTSTDIKGLLAKDTGNHFVQIVGCNPKGGSKAIKVAICSISGGKTKPYADYIIDTVKRAASETETISTRILAVHARRYVGWGDYLADSTTRVRLRQVLDTILAQHPNIKYVRLFSNIQEFVTLPSDAGRVDIKDLEIPNRAFVEKTGEGIKDPWAASGRSE